MITVAKVKRSISALKELFYPRICPCCGDHIQNQQTVICVSCLIFLPYTNFHQFKVNPLHKKFWGRMEIQHADSLLFMEKSSKTQKLMYLLKYSHRQDIGTFLSEQTIQRYLNHSFPSTIQAIVIVPLHPRKEKQRGYNQCHTFAQHLSISWQVPYLKNALTRISHSQSQTGNTRIERWENVANIFTLAKKDAILNKHILLIDDVLTTGATLEACGQEILKLTGTKLSILTMACKV